MPPNNSEKYELGQGWKLATKLATDEALVVKSAEYPPEGQQLIWLCFDPASGRRAPLPVGSHQGAGTRPTFLRRTNEFAFAAGGITAYSFETRRTRTLADADPEYEHVQRLWLSNETIPRLLYLLARDAESASSRRARFEAGEKQPFNVVRTYSLWSVSTTGGDARCVVEFADWPTSIDIDWTRNVAVVLLQREKIRGGKIVEINLNEGKQVTSLPTDRAALMASPHQTILAWGHYKPGVTEIHGDGRETLFSQMGWYPSFAPNGRRFAFTVYDNELWLQDADGAPERILSVLMTPDGQRYHDEIVWCACGHHFAVALTSVNPTPNAGTMLVIVDCERREIMIREDLPAITSCGERAWVPAAAVESFF